MKNTGKLIFILIITFIFSIMIYSAYMSFKFENARFNQINLEDSTNKVINYSSIQYLDTLTYIMLDDLNINNTEIVLHNVSDLVRANIFNDELVDGFVIVRFDGVIQVFIYPFKTRMKTFQVLAHELIHVAQIIKGDLAVVNSEIAVWKNDTLNINEIDYRKRAWEIEAYANQIKLSNAAKKILID